MMSTVVRCIACTRCKEYVVVHQGDRINELDVKKFEAVHSGHPTVAVPLHEVVDMYRNFRE